MGVGQLPQAFQFLVDIPQQFHWVELPILLLQLLALRNGTLREPFSASDLNSAMGITWACKFLYKHCGANKQKGYTTLFTRFARQRPFRYVINPDRREDK